MSTSVTGDEILDLVDQIPTVIHTLVGQRGLVMIDDSRVEMYNELADCDDKYCPAMLVETDTRHNTHRVLAIKPFASGVVVLDEPLLVEKRNANDESDKLAHILANAVASTVATTRTR